MVKFINLDRHWKEVGSKVQTIADNTYQKGLCQKSPLLEEIEDKISSIVNKRYAITFSSCTDALTQGLRNLNLPRESEILVPDYTYIATLNSIKLAGYVPILVDVDNFYHINLLDAQTKINNKTRAILYVTLLGSPAHENIDEWCNKNNLTLVEDAAQSFGTSLANSKFSVLSFSPSKPCTTFGSGGALVTNDIQTASQAIKTRLQGDDKNIGINSMLSTFEASALKVNLDLIDIHLSRRREIVEKYFMELPSIYNFPKYRKNCTYSKFIIQTQDRDKIKKYLDKKQIQTMIHYNKEFNLENSKKLGKCSLTLPNCSYMSDKEVEEVIQCLKEF
tara:strand:- start:49674 stop:50675 length:1002 start_codon:yes stop_codon:yes gene_type:complete